MSKTRPASLLRGGVRDLRHSFIDVAHDQGVNEIFVRLLVGHPLTGVHASYLTALLDVPLALKVSSAHPRFNKFRVFAIDRKCLPQPVEFLIIYKSKLVARILVLTEISIFLIYNRFYNDCWQYAALPPKCSKVRHLRVYTEGFPFFVETSLKPTRVVYKQMI
jgi:hypothetical protein